MVQRVSVNSSSLPLSAMVLNNFSESALAGGVESLKNLQNILQTCSVGKLVRVDEIFPSEKINPISL